MIQQMKSGVAMSEGRSVKAHLVADKADHAKNAWDKHSREGKKRDGGNSYLFPQAPF